MPERRAAASLALVSALVFALALLARGAYLERASAGPLGNADSAGYEALAETLKAGRPYEGAELWLPGGFPADLLRPPGYPLFLSLASASAGSDRLRVAWAQSLVGALTAVFVALAVGGLTGDARAALAAGLFQALDWASIVHTPLSIAEVWFSFVLFAAVAAFAWRLAGGAAWLTPAAGLLLGAAALVKPIALAVAAAFALAALSRRLRAAELAALLACFGAVTLPWMLRNWNRHGLFTLSPVASVNLALMGNSTLERGERSRRNQELTAVQGSPAERVARNLDVGLARAAEAWPIFVQKAVVGWLRACLGIATRTVEVSIPAPQRPPWWSTSLLPLAHLGALWLLAALAVRRRAAPGAPDARVVIFLLAVVACLLLPTGEAGYARFRVPATPALALLAGLGLAKARPRIYC